MLQTVRQGLRLVGPLVGAALYAALGGWALAGIGMVGFVTAAAVVDLRCPAHAPAPPTMRLRWPAEVGAGLRHLAGEPALRRALLGYGLGSLVMGFSESLIFAYVDQGLDRDAAFVGVLVTVQGVGGLVGGLCSADVVRRLGEVGTLAAGVAFFGPAALALAYPDLRLGLLAVLLAGVSLPLTMVGLHTLIQRRTPPGLLGRVAAASQALVSGPQAISIGAGALLVGCPGLPAAVRAGGSGRPGRRHVPLAGPAPERAVRDRPAPATGPPDPSGAPPAGRGDEVDQPVTTGIRRAPRAVTESDAASGRTPVGGRSSRR